METQTAPSLLVNKYLPPRANLTPTEVADFLSCTVPTVYDQIHSGLYPAFPLIGRGLGQRPKWRIPRDSFLEWFETVRAHNQTSLR